MTGRRTKISSAFIGVPYSQFMAAGPGVSAGGSVVMSRPSRSLKDPAAATSSPTSRPFSTTMLPPTTAPVSMMRSPGAAFAVLRLYDKDMLSCGRAAHRGQGYDNALSRNSRVGDYVDEGTRPQHGAKRLAQCAETDRAVAGIDAVVLGKDLDAAWTVRECRARDRHFVARMQECCVFLWQCEIDVHVVVDALQAHDESSDFEVGAGLQVGDTDAGFEGRDDALALDDNFEALGTRGRGGEVLARLVELLDREGWTVTQRFTAIKIGAGQAGLGFGSGKRSLFLTVIELNEYLAFFDGVARGEATFGD